MIITDKWIIILAYKEWQKPDFLRRYKHATGESLLQKLKRERKSLSSEDPQAFSNKKVVPTLMGTEL